MTHWPAIEPYILPDVTGDPPAPFRSAAPGAPLHLCTACDPPHIVDNCPTCFCYGLHPGGTPVSASLEPASWIPCPVCGGTPVGAPGGDP